MNKTSYIASTISITLLLFLLGVVGYFYVNAERATSQLVQGLKISVVLNDDVTAREKTDIEDHLKSDPDVADFTYQSVEDATAEFEQNTGIKVDTTYGANPIPASFEVTPVSLEKAAGVEDRAVLQAGVAEIYYPREIAQEVESRITFVGKVALYGGILLLAITLLLMYSTLSLAIASSAEEIRTMQLVGAKNSFIKAPFIRRSIVQGFLAALFATGLMLLFNELFATYLGEQLVRDDAYWGEMAVVGSALCVIGVLICLIFTTIVLAFTVKRRKR